MKIGINFFGYELTFLFCLDVYKNRKYRLNKSGENALTIPVSVSFDMSYLRHPITKRELYETVKSQGVIKRELDSKIDFPITQLGLYAISTDRGLLKVWVVKEENGHEEVFET